MKSDQLRVGDAERDRVTEALHEHFAAGRLTRDELDQRLTVALSAKTAGDLRAITHDLPGGAETPARSGPWPYAGPGDLEESPWPRARFGPGTYAGRGDLEESPWLRARFGPGTYAGRGDLDESPWPRTRSGRWPQHGTAYWGRHPWRPRPGPPFGVFFLAIFLVLGFTLGWAALPVLFLFPALAFMIVRRTRHHRHRPLPRA